MDLCKWGRQDRFVPFDVELGGTCGIEEGAWDLVSHDMSWRLYSPKM